MAQLELHITVQVRGKGNTAYGTTQPLVLEFESVLLPDEIVSAMSSVLKATAEGYLDELRDDLPKATPKER